MVSALKFIAAAAIVALFGGFLLAGILTTQQGEDAVPAAVSDSPTAAAASDVVSHDAAIVNGRQVGGDQTSIATVTQYEDTTLSEGAQWRMELTEIDDPRLNGTFQVVWNAATYDGVLDVITATGRIENEHGSWIGVEHGYGYPTRGWNWQGLYEGQGAYEGLSALLFWEEEGPVYEAHGFIIPGEMLEPLDAPESVAATE